MIYRISYVPPLPVLGPLEFFVEASSKIEAQQYFASLAPRSTGRTIRLATKDEVENLEPVSED